MNAKTGYRNRSPATPNRRLTAAPAHGIRIALAAFLLVGMSLAGLGQNFRNLDFEDGTLVSEGYPFVQFDTALPGWTGTFDQTKVTSAVYNTMALDGPAISIIDSNAPAGLTHGRFCVFLQAGWTLFPMGVYPTSIVQTGTVPASASSMLFNALLWTNSGVTGVPLEVTFHGTPIPWVVVTATSNYMVLGGDVSRFAGQTGQLKFTAPYLQGQPHNSVYLDYIRFSSEALTAAPVILEAPQSQMVDVGSSVEFAVNAIGHQPLAYQWFFNSTNALIGATSSVLTLTNVGSGQSGSYCVVVANAFGVVTSAPAMLRVGTLAVARISMSGGSSGDYNTLRFTFGYTGGGTLTHGLFSQLPLGTNDVGRVFPVTQADETNFAFIVSILTNGISDLVGCEIETPSGGPATSTREPDFFAPLPRGANGIDFAGFHIDNIALEIDKLSFTPHVGGGLRGTDYAVNFQLFVNSVPWSRPVIITPPVSQTAEAGSPVVFGMRTQEDPALIYQWFFNETNVMSDATTISGLRLKGAEFSQAGSYSVVVSNAFGSVTSAPATLSVIAPVERRWVPGLILSSQSGSALNLDTADALVPTPNWAAFDSIVLTNDSQWYFDLSVPLPMQRFYRAWQTGAPSVLPALDFHMIPTLTLTGATGSTVRVDGINQFGPTSAWFPLSKVTLTNTYQFYFDTSVIGQPRRLWRVVPVP